MRFLFLVVFGVFMINMPVYAKITGPFKGLHPSLKSKLRVIERHFGHVHITPHGGCRKHGNRMAPKSYHRIAVGCKAADIIVKGASGKTILSFWQRKGWGGTGYYCGRPFVHVDIGPRRSWKWFCGRKRRYARKRK